MRNKRGLDPKNRAKQILKRNGNDFKKAIAQINNKISKSVKNTLGYFYYLDVLKELKKTKKQ